MFYKHIFLVLACLYKSTGRDIAVTMASMSVLKSFIKVFKRLHLLNIWLEVQSTLVISNSKGLSEILQDIRTSTYQICRIEEKK